MGEYLVFPLLGLGNGAVFAALALSLVITYRSSGVVNFATGATALYIAYTYSFLRDGQLLIPFPGLPATVDIGAPLTASSAMLVALVVAAIFGALLYLIVFRPLRDAPPVAKAVASIGVMIVLQGVLAQRVGTQPVSTPPIFPTGTVTLAGVNVRTEFFWIAATIVVLAAVLWVAYRFTRFGLVTRAVAETEKGARVTGLSPQRIALINWMIGTMVAGLAGILIAPISPVVPVSYTLFIVPALAAAVVAKSSSIGVAVAAGLAIGAVQAELDLLASRWDWLPETGRAELVPLALLLVFLVLKGSGLPTRGTIFQRTLGLAPRPTRIGAPAIIAGIVGLAAVFATTGSARNAVVTSLIFSVIALSLVVVAGYAGQVSLAQLTLAGASAYLLAAMSTDWGIPFPIAPILSALGATVIGVVVGLPALRVRALSVAIVTLSLAVALEAVWFRNSKLTGGFAGSEVKDPTLFGIDLGPGSGTEFPRLGFALLCLVVLIAVGVGVAALRRSRLGAAMLAVRANERSAAAAGVDVVRTKLAAFAIGAFIAGLGGALLGYKQTVVTADIFSALAGLGLLAIVYVAGITSIAGGVVAGSLVAGGVVFRLLDEVIEVGGWYVTLSGVALVLTVIAAPEGVVRPFHDLVGHLDARRRQSRAAVSVEPADKEVRDPSTSAPLQPADPTGASRSARTKGAGRSLLVVEGLTVHYGGVTALQDVSLQVAEGDILGLIGPNGAGKTTLIDAVSGFTRATGHTNFLGRSLDGLRPHVRARAGLARTFQSIELYDDLTVEENIIVGTEAFRRRGGAGSGHAVSARGGLDGLFELLRLESFRHRPARELSQGQRQLVSVARALAGRPKVVLLDEPAAGLDFDESAWLGQRLRDVSNSGVTIVLIDHDMDLVLSVCDRVVVLDLGCVIAHGSSEEIKRDAVVRAAYLGTEVESAG